MVNEMDYDVVIGLEIHIELATESKLFCACSTKFAAEPNTQCCPVCTGMPGALPVMNRKAVDYAATLGLAVNCTLAHFSKMDRKNYFYPDLPKGYQISQFDAPICSNGHVDIKTEAGTKRVRILRIHLEEDAGKLNHMDGYTCVDMNRCCIPLLELVTEPDISSAQEARSFVEKIKAICEYTGVSDCKMQEGSLRCDVNISLKKKGQEKLGTRTETKNLNSFRSIVGCIEAEIDRQAGILDSGGEVLQQTLRYDDTNGSLHPLRDKEYSHDYRYFPEPDLIEIELSESHIAELRCALPVLPDERKQIYIDKYGLNEYDAFQMSGSRALAELFESSVNQGCNAKGVSNLLMGVLQECLKQSGMEIEDIRIKPHHIADLLELIESGKISSGVGKQVFMTAFETGGMPSDIVKDGGLMQLNDEGVLEETVLKIIAENPKSVEDYRSGKAAALKYLVGLCMKQTKGKGNPVKINELLIDKLTL